MPIYKVASPLPVFGAKYRGFEVSQSVAAASTPHGHNGSGEVRLVHEDNGGHSKDTERGHALPSPHEAHHQIEPMQVVVGPGSRRETLIEREVREQLKREAELSAQQGSPSTISFAEDTDTTRHNVRVISSTDENGGRSERNHHHGVPDSVGLSREGAVVEEQRTVVVVSTSPDGGVHRTTTTTTTTNTSGGGGSVKTGNEGTPGGSWILHELQAQAAREKELRKHRKEMGWEVEGRHASDDLEMDQARYSGGTWADKRVELDVVDSRGMEEHSSVVPDILVEGPGNNDGTSSYDHHHHHRPRSPAAGRRNTQKVQPFEDVERIQSEIQMIYVPQNETPIDREIRLQREREEALRFSRGIFSSVHGSSPEIEVEVLRPRPIEEGGGPTSGDLGLSMKKFAESRLRNELEREKRRELDLLKEGKIIVLSADRTPDAMPFVEVISPEKVELRELARKISAERQSGVNDAASKEMAWNEVTLRDSTTPRNDMSWQESTSRDNTLPRSAASNEMSWHEAAPRVSAPRNVTSKEITSHSNSAPRGKTWNNVAPIQSTTKKVVLVELPHKEDEHFHLDPVHVEVHNGHGNDDKSFVDAKFHTPSPKSETHLTVTSTRSTERSGKGMKTKAVSPNSYSEEDVQKILLTVAERRIEEEIAETKKRELELRELRKHRLSSEIPREPEDVNNNNNSNAHAQSSVSVKIETDHKSPSPQPIRDGNRRDDVAEVHVTTAAFDNVDFHQQPIDGQGGVKARRLALIDQWERGIIQRSD